MLAGVLAAGCTTETSGTPPGDDTPSATLHYLTPTQHLTRASIALRGVRPSVAELQAVDADPSQLPAIVDRYLETPEFAQTIKELHNESLLLRAEQPNLTIPALAGLMTTTFSEMNGSLVDEPLELIKHVVMTDAPYTDIVTADYTMANQIVATVWGLPHTGPADAWEQASWTDGRGAAGILSTSELFYRWRSTGFNYNRGRANMVSRALLCHDYLESDIVVDTNIDLSDPDVVADAVVKNPSCAGCHQTLDPLASYFFGHRGNIVSNTITSYPVSFWLPAQVNGWQRTNKRPPMYFGEAATGLAGLGKKIADDPRFARCAAIHFASYLTEVPQRDLSGAWVAKLQDTFVSKNFSAKQLVKAVVLSDEFKVSHDTDEARADHLVGTLRARPDQLARMFADLTGFSWTTTSPAKIRAQTIGTTNLWASDFIGFRVLAGGIDSYFVTEPVFTMNATSNLVVGNAASAAADFVVEHDATAALAARTLFVAADVTDTAEAKVRAELVHLHARIYGELLTAGAPEIDDTYALFTGALTDAGGDAKRAWKVTLIGMLSDFRSLFY